MKKQPTSTKTDWKDSVIIRDNWKYQCDGNLPFPRIIQFQTHSYCNAACIICPYGEVHKKHDNGYMDDQLIDKIIHECTQQQDTAYEFLPFLMNEPTMDERIPAVVTKIKQRSPQSAVSIYTNGSSKQKAFWNKLLESAPDTIVFNANSIDRNEYRRITRNLSYDDFLANILYVKQIVQSHQKDIELIAHVLRLGKTTQELVDVMKFWEERGIKCRTAYVENRAGNIKIESVTKHRNFFAPQKCWRVLSQIHILYDGRVVLCCGDWRRRVILGNIREQTIAEVWNQEAYIRIRMSHKNQDSNHVPSICSKCNMKGTV